MGGGNGSAPVHFFPLNTVLSLAYSRPTGSQHTRLKDRIAWIAPRASQHSCAELRDMAGDRSRPPSSCGEAWALQTRYNRGNAPAAVEFCDVTTLRDEGRCER